MMKKNIINRALKNIIFLILIFSFILFLFFGLFFNDFKEKLFINAKNSYQLNIDKFTKKLEEKVILFDKESIELLVSDAKGTGFIQNIKIKLDKYIFDKDTLIFQTKTFNDTSWNLADVTIDTKFGEIQKIENSQFFEFKPSNLFNFNEKLILKYQLFKNNEIKSFIAQIDLNLLEEKKIEKKEIDFLGIFEHFYNLKIDDIVTKDLVLKDIIYGTVEFTLDDYKLKKEVYDYFIKLLFLAIFLFVPAVIFMFYYNRYLDNKYIVKPIKYLDKVVSDLIENKFSNIDNKMFEGSVEYKNLVSNISKLSNKIASLVNELNINKDTLERNLLVDSLTGLYDKRMFDIDMKSMFVSSVEGYIFLLKIAKLNQIEKLNGTLRTDDFILSFVNIVNNVIQLYKDKSISCYRFNGSEFIILAKELKYLEALDFADKIVANLTNNIFKAYELPSDIFHIGAVPVDQYGTIDSILTLVNERYSKALSKGKDGYDILEESRGKEEIKKNEMKVKKIIEQNDFDISFVFDSYSFGGELLMRELKPNLKDDDNNIFPIGLFVAVSEKLDLNRKFDTEVILKAIDFIKNNKIDYKIAINLSIKTVSNPDFIIFLEDLVSKNEDFVKHIVFSITSYSASAYKNIFIDFVAHLNRIGIEILIKRYKTKELSLDELANIRINYIKIDKELTQNIHNDVIKKHKIKNIIIFAEINDIKVLVENIESDRDYLYLNKLDLYAVNR